MRTQSHRSVVLLLLMAGLFGACDSNEPRQVEIPDLRVVADSLYTTTETGLKYYDFTVGDGAVAEVGQLVQVHYNGWLTGGLLFDSSYLVGSPLIFELGVGQVIAGWDEGIAGMRVGGDRQLVIPPALGYGSQTVGPIPPNSTLIFEVQLLAVDTSNQP